MSIGFRLAHVHHHGHDGRPVGVCAQTD